MSNKTFDVLAYVQRIILPALATLIATLGQIWHWDAPVEQIVLTITAVDTFMGVVLRISSNNYFKGDEPLDWEGIEAELDHEDKWGGLG